MTLACGCSRLGIKEIPTILEKAELFGASHAFHVVQLLLDCMQPRLSRRHPTLTGICVCESDVYRLRVVIFRHYCERNTSIKELLSSLPKIPVIQKFD